MIENMLVWNVRGFGTSKRRTRSSVRKFKVLVFAILEHFQSVDKLQRWACTLDMPCVFSNADMDGKIWLCWKQGIDMEAVGHNNQCISVLFTDQSGSILTSIVYAKCSYLERRALWDHLCGVSAVGIPWVVIGDFNVIRSNEERVGGNSRLRMAMDEFNCCIHSCGLIEWRLEGKQLSWCNGRQGLARSWAKLDRILVNNFGGAVGRLLNRRTSDHSPIVLQLSSINNRYGSSPFRFQNMWTLHLGFLTLVENTWKSSRIQGNGLEILVGKHKKLKLVLRSWNKEVFGHVDNHILKLEGKVELLEEYLQQNFSYEVDADLTMARNDLELWAHREEIRLAQQAKKGWLEEGDQNSKFFHAVIIQRRNQACVKQMRLPDGSTLDSPEMVHEGATVYFEQFMTNDVEVEEPMLEDIIQPVLSLQDIEGLTSLPMEQEVKDAFLSINVNSSPGPDGFGYPFFFSILAGILLDRMLWVL
ncbi:hypothetical protein I3842_05G199000 [Carya illinoinensis]|uniref:Uncharacterized protein n=2 Tax=Carya illinoinensis TaxID=32201 RepID=A0A922F1U0_CARIL|nr:hypothetical protein I3842_05G199000 [Carya illinoinensis]